MNIDVVTIDSILLEHVAMVRYIERLRTAVADQATFLLQSSDHWDKTQLKELKDRYLSLRDSLQEFRNSLIGHCAHEEKALYRLLGKSVTNGLIVEHKEIIGHVDTAHTVLNGTELLGDLNPSELMATTYNVEQAIETACQMVDAHEANEVGMFVLLKKGLQTE